MNGDSWLMDRLADLYGDRYDLVASADGVTAIPHEEGRDPLRASSPLVLGILLGQAAAEIAHAEPPLERCQRDDARVQGIHEAREARQ